MIGRAARIAAVHRGAGRVDHAGLVSGLRCAAGVDVAGWDDDALLAAARDVEVARSLLESFSGHVAVQLDARKTTEARCGLGTPRWLAQSPRQAHRDCRARLRVAKRLATDLRAVDAAVADGRLSWAHATVIVQAANPRIRSEMTQIQDSLIDAADGCVFEHWANFIKALARQLDVDGGYDPTTDISSNKATLRVDTEGTLMLDAELVAANAIEVQASIEAVTDELFRRYNNDRAQDPSLDIPRRATLRALAIVEICRRRARREPRNPSATDQPHRHRHPRR